ncbi:hypothetical protein DLJ59_24600 [Micromonospora inaquosa]|uniref:Uncharacterized protein n=1 Tax=Micromonospora inaquosa TaxID=2203716 RepID=A0A3N9WZA2_9ACTN|nr:hypothetical protein DLJ59_24600 [Micromonospora inaquosa]
MRYAPLLLAGAAACALAHVVGILTGHPIWRYAEVWSVGLLLAFAVVAGLPAPRWAVPAAVTALLVDSVRSIPIDANTAGWQVFEPGDGVDTLSGFNAGLSLCASSLAAVTVLLVVWRRVSLGCTTAVVALVATSLFGYSVVRAVDIWLAVPTEQGQYLTGTGQAETVIAVSLAALPPLALGFTALALAAALAERGRRLASSGAVLLALITVPLVEASIGAVPLPFEAGHRTAFFAWQVAGPRFYMPHLVSAMTTAAQLTAYMLIVVGLIGRYHRAHDAPPEEAGG